MAKYIALAEWLSRETSETVVVQLEEIERVLGFQLPESARRYQAFWLNPTVAEDLASKGWRAYPRLAAQRVEFRRESSVGLAGERARQAPTTPNSKPDLVFVGCVKSKLAGRHRARDLYTSALFRGRMRYADAAGVPWFVLSALYGLLAPDDMIEDYDVSLVDASSEERRHWASGVLASIDARIGPIENKTIEIHAGDQYRDRSLLEGLASRGARVVIPLQGVPFGSQLAWYGNDATREGSKPPSPAAPSTTPTPVGRDMQGLARRISEDFTNGNFDLSGRPGAPPPSWESMPEMVAERSLHELGASPQELRLFITFLAAMDRARDADRLWRNGIGLFRDFSWTFDPAQCSSHSLAELRDALASRGVSQRHGPDAAAWRLIAEALADDSAPKQVRRAVIDGAGDAPELLSAVRALRPGGHPWFPFLAGPKISEMWVRLLVVPGAAQISNLEHLMVAVDVQVRKVTEYLAVTDTGPPRPLEDVRAAIEQAWQAQAADVVAPDALSGTAAGLDPALWFMAKWGCTYCERASRQLPISRVCGGCRFPNRG